MKILVILVGISLTITLSILHIVPSQESNSSVDTPKPAVVDPQIQQILASTLQILMFSTEAVDALKNGSEQMPFNESLSRTDITINYQLGLGTLVEHQGEIILITHDHWISLNTLGAVLFRNASGDPLLELKGDEFKDLIRYQDSGTMILGISGGANRVDYLAALSRISMSKYFQTINPIKLDSSNTVKIGQNIVVVRQPQGDSSSVDLVNATVVSIEERWGQPVYRLQNQGSAKIMPGDSGGGLWLGGQIVGNMWKSKPAVGWNWKTLKPETQWSQTSFGAALPNQIDQIIQLTDSAENENTDQQITSEIEY